MESFFEKVNCIQAQLSASLDELKSWVSYHNEKIDLQIGYIREEIEIRIESMKIELEKLHEKYLSELDHLKIDLSRLVTSRLVEGSDSIVIYADHYTAKLEELRTDIGNSLVLTEQKVADYQTELSDIDLLLVKMKKWNFQISIDVSREEVCDKLLGSLIYDKNYKEDFNNGALSDNENTISNKLKNTSFDNIYLRSEPKQLCALSNGYILCCSHNPFCIEIFDEKMNHLDTIGRIENSSIYPECITTDDHDKIFIAESHIIITTDFTFRRMQRIGQKGTAVRQFNSICSIAYSEKKLYVSESQNSRIQVFDDNLVFIQFIKLPYMPRDILISKQTICVRESYGNSIYFYNTTPFSLKSKYDGHCGRLSKVNDNIYECDWFGKRIYCYDHSGKLIEEIKNPSFPGNVMKNFSYDSGSIILQNESVYISCKTNKKLVKF